MPATRNAQMNMFIFRAFVVVGFLACPRFLRFASLWVSPFVRFWAAVEIQLLDLGAFGF
jgi:hypothetical protein